MDEFWPMWSGQLMVGTKDMGPAVIWSLYNIPIPPINGKLEMTCMAEYDDLWINILQSEQHNLSWNSLGFIRSKTVSVFTITSNTPQFLQLTQELIQTQKPRILTGEVINPEQLIEIVLVPHCPELQNLGLKCPTDSIQPSLLIIFVSTSLVKSTFDREERIHQFTQVYGDITSCNIPRKSMMVECSEINNKSEQKHNGNTKSDKKKGSRSCERKRSTVHTTIGEPRKCKWLGTTNLVNFEEIKEEKVVKMHEKHYLENNEKLEKDDISAKGCVKPGECLEKATVLSHVDRVKDFGKNMNNIVCADKGACNVSAEICFCKNFDLGDKDKHTVVTATASGNPSSEEQQPVGSDKTNMLDTKKFNEIFFSKDTSKPDLIKPSMLKKSSKKNDIKRNIKHLSTSQEGSGNDSVIPDLFKHCEVLNKKSNRKNEKRPLKRREDHRPHSRDLPKGFFRNSTDKCTAMLQRNDKKSEGKEKQEKEMESKDVVKSEVKNVEMNFSPSEIVSDKNCVIIEEKETLNERETDLEISQLPSSWTSKLLEIDVNQQTAKLRDSVSLGQFEMKVIANLDMREEKMSICSKLKTNEIKSLIAKPGLKRKPDETKKAIENVCNPIKNARVILKDIMKGSGEMEISRLLHSQKLDDISNKTCLSKEVIEPIYHIDTPQPSLNHKMFDSCTDLKSRNVCEIGSLQESCKRNDTEQSADEFQQLSFADRVIDHVKEEDSVKQKSSFECHLDINSEEKRSKTRVKVHALCINGFQADTIELHTELSELQGVEDHPLDLSFYSYPSQPCNLEHQERDMRLSAPDREFTQPVGYMDPSFTSYPKVLNRTFENKDFDKERSIQENCKRKGIEQSSDKLQCTFANDSTSKMCFIDCIKEPPSLRQELFLDCKMSVDEDKKNEISLKENGRDSVFDAIQVKTEVNKIAHGDFFSHLFLQEQPKCQRKLNSPQFGVDAGTKEINEEMHFDNLPSSTLERWFVDLFHKTLAVDANITSVLTGTILLDCITDVPSLNPKDREESCISNQFLTKPSLPPLSSLNSYAVEKIRNLLSETAKLIHLQKLGQAEKSLLLWNESSYLFSEVLKIQKNVKENNELITGLMGNGICKEGWLIQNNESHPLDYFNIPCSIVRSSSGIHSPTGAAREIRHKSIESHDIRNDLNRSSVTLSHSPGFNAALLKQKKCDVESLFQEINIKIQAYILAHTSYDTHNQLHGGIETLADFIETSTTAHPNFKCTTPITGSSSIEDQEERLVTSSQQLKMFIIQQLTKLHVSYKMENLIMTPHYSSEVDALCLCQKSRHLYQQFKQIECQNGTLSTYDMIEYFLELPGVRGNSVSSFEGLTDKYPSFAECLTNFTSNQQIDLCQGGIAPKIILFTPNDLYQPSWKESHSGRLDEGLQVQRYIHLFKADHQDVKLKCLSMVHDMSYASLEEIKKYGGNIYIQPSAVDHLLAHPVLANICHLSHIQFGVYNSLSALLNGGAKPILKSKWLLLVHHTAIVDESFVELLQEMLRNEDFSSHHHDCVFIPILTLKTCIDM
ncbi:uncharacterized protein [Panulirus ornatus]|uniref:uncharacterized protein n=1 Tax=Panulirus ornatus TaxID=150431 RepID=UPI003A83D4EA